MTLHNVLPTLALVCLVLALAGCSGTSDAPQPSEAEIEAELAKLSPADRDAAVAQRVCPVSDERLGAMPGVAKVTVEGRDVFLCCESCKPDFEKEPAKYLAKLDADKGAK
jgi:YHS domain-containing protein